MGDSLLRLEVINARDFLTFLLGHGGHGRTVQKHTRDEVFFVLFCGDRLHSAAWQKQK
jgi:hypothetical protein